MAPLAGAVGLRTAMSLVPEQGLGCFCNKGLGCRVYRVYRVDRVDRVYRVYRVYRVCRVCRVRGPGFGAGWG